MIAKIALGAAGTLAAVIGISAGAYIPFVLSDAKKNFNDKCDYLLILGGNVIDAETPSPQLLERMKAAAKYLNENESVIAIPCGACFRKEQKKSEARIIADYLINRGVDENRIILEEKSTTTFENFEFGAEIIKNHSKKDISDLRIAFLSSDYHMHRAALIAKKSGFKNCGRISCKTGGGSAAKRLCREYIVAYELFYRYLFK